MSSSSSVAYTTAPFKEALETQNEKEFRVLRRQLRVISDAKGGAEFNEAKTVFLQKNSRLQNNVSGFLELIKFERLERNYRRICKNKAAAFHSAPELSKGHDVSFHLGLAAVPVVAQQAIGTNARLTNEIAMSRVDIQQTRAHTREILNGLKQLRANIVDCGTKYRNCTPASVRGRQAEVFITDTINLDSTVKRSPVHATCPDSRAPGSPDIVVTDSRGEIYNFSSKYHGAAKDSVNAQLDPRLDGQGKLIPADQVCDGRIYGTRRADRELKRGRLEVAGRHRKNASEITDKISVDGVESTPLKKQQADKLARVVTTNENGAPKVKMSNLDTILDETGVSAKVDKAVTSNVKRIQKRKSDITKARRACVHSEIKGAVAAAGIAAATAAVTSAAFTLIENGISVETVQSAIVNGAKSGAEGGLLAMGTYGIARTAGEVLTKAATAALSSAGINVTANVAAATGLGVIGTLTTVAVSGYTFVKMKTDGASTKEALAATGKNAGISLAITAATGVATLALGATAGAIVSASIGIGMLGFSLFKAFRKRRKDKARYDSQAGWGSACFA